MPADLAALAVALPRHDLVGFGLVLARMAGIFTFVPLPGSSSVPVVAKVMLSAVLALLVYPMLPARVQGPDTASGFAVLIALEFAKGIAVAVIFALLNEMMSFAIQCLSLQAGYSYASSIDPSSEADTNTLQVLAQLASGMLFFSLGLHHALIRALVGSFSGTQAATDVLTPQLGTKVIEYAGAVLMQGVRIALPVIGLLLLTDLTLALLSRLQSQLQLLSLSFPVKSLVALLTLAATFQFFASAYSSTARMALRTAAGFLVPYVTK